MNEKYFVSVIIPAHNRSDLLEKCLESVMGNTHNQDLEVIVVDDCSHENLEEVVSRYNTRFIKLSGAPKGPAYARNKASEIANGKYLLFIDSDVQLSPGWIETVKEEVKNNPDVNIIQGRYEKQHSNFFSDLRNYYCIFKYKKLSAVNNTTYSVNSYCFLIRKDIFEKIGKFDEKIKAASIEDDDLGWRLRGAGYKILLSSQLKVIHLKKYNLVTLMKRAYNQAFYKIKWILRKKKNIHFKHLPISLNSFSKMIKTVLSFPLGIMIFAILFLLPVTPQLACWLLIILILLFIWLNYEFLSLLIHEKGLVYSILGGIVFSIELSAAFLGSIVGLVDFSLLKKRY